MVVNNQSTIKISMVQKPSNDKPKIVKMLIRPTPKQLGMQ